MLQKVWVWIYVYQVLHTLFVTQWKCQLSKGKFSNFPNEKFLKHVHDCLSDRLLNFPSHSTRPRTSPELEICVLWILKSSLFVNLQINLSWKFVYCEYWNLLFLLICRLICSLFWHPRTCLKFNQSKCCLQKPTSKSEAGTFWTQPMRELLLVGTQLGYLKDKA